MIDSNIQSQLENIDINKESLINKISEEASKLDLIFIYGDTEDNIIVKGLICESHQADTGIDFSISNLSKILKKLKIQSFYFGELDDEEINTTKIPWTFNSLDPNVELIRFNINEEGKVYSQGIIVNLKNFND